MSERRPHEPPRTTDQPAVAEGIGPDPEDFVVQEIPLYPPTGEGEHWMIELRKRGWTTPDAARAVARAAGVAERDVGHAGMKDRHAVTTQWLTVPARSTAPDTWALPDDLTVVSYSRHGSKIRTGHLAGNRFTIRLVGRASEGVDRAQTVCNEILSRGLPNYFGAQRFGRAGSNLEEALRWLEADAPPQGKRTRFQRKLFPSVVQSEVFNRYLSARRALGFDRLLAGEVVRLDGSRSVFVVEDPEGELPRLRARDIHLTGPLPGPKSRAAAGEALALEQRIISDLGLDATLLATLARHADGTRRDLLIWPEGLVVRGGDRDDLTIDVTLPPGAYATQLLRELLPTAWLERGTRVAP